MIELDEPFVFLERLTDHRLFNIRLIIIQLYLIPFGRIVKLVSVRSILINHFILFMIKLLISSYKTYSIIISIENSIE